MATEMDMDPFEGLRVRPYIAYQNAAVAACKRLGLTAEQLDAGVIDNLVRTAKQFLPEVMSVRPAGNGITKQMNLQSALRPFTQESRDDSNI